MPAKRKQKNHRQQNSSNSFASNSDKIISCSYVTMSNIIFSASGSPQTVSLNSSFGTRHTEASLQYQFFRVVKMDIELLPVLSTGSTYVVSYLSVEPGVTSLTAYADLCEVLYSRVVSHTTTIPQHLRIPRKHLLATPEKWFACSGSSTAYNPTQGELIVRPETSATMTVRMRIRYTVQYSGATVGSADLVPRSVMNDRLNELIEKFAVAEKSKYLEMSPKEGRTSL